MPKRVSCGVAVTDGAHLLIGQAARSPLWDIPKGLAESGEEDLDAARRELREETGLNASAEALIPLGLHAYMPGKDLVLFLWRVEAMPDPATLRCSTRVPLPGGKWVPEMIRFDTPPWDTALPRLGKNMQRVLTALRAAILRG
ncbi:NUDIX domain-containing protein [Muricoccus radiodurans]|uniref:NUDIX domain-containing protein n=1 Tax=Muricoccus radiodurans TaxID=2231721 RepID=UPI003CEA44C2